LLLVSLREIDEILGPGLSCTPGFMLPPFIVSVVFIHAGGLHGSATTLRLGLMEIACFTSGMM
jgi:hypothetical protein